MELDALRFANFSKLGTAIDDWSAMITKLEQLKTDAGTQLDGRAKKANWSGVNATVTRSFITKTAGEFGDAVTQATTIRNILRDTRDELVEYKGKLEDAIERGLKKNLTVMDTGNGGFTVTMNIHPDRAAKGHQVPDHTEFDVTTLRDEVKGILEKATESDNSAAKVLVAIVNQSPRGFSDASYKDRDSAANALKRAEDMARLAKDPKNLTKEQFDELNRELAKYKDDDLFAEKFATELGPKGTAQFWVGIHDFADNYGLRDKLGDYGDLQKNLSMTLANATQSDSPAMQQWEKDMVAVGRDRITTGHHQYYGFQVVSSLMRTGDFDDKFLNDYGKALVDEEKKRTANGRNFNALWHGPGLGGPALNHLEGDGGKDPMTGFMKALSNSPDAATEFFNGTYVTKDEDHNFKDGDNKKQLTNFDYLFEERKWPEDIGKDLKPSSENYNALGEALEAATTGHPAGEQPSKDHPPHTEAQANLMEQVVQSVSEKNKRVTDHDVMSDSLGQMAAEYMPDINRAMSDDKLGNTNLLFPLAGSQADMTHQDISRFLVTVGQDPDGYARVELGQKEYAANLMGYHMNPNLPPELRHPGSPENTIKEIATRSGEIGGSLAIGRQEAIMGPAHEKDEAFEHSMNQMKNVVTGTISGGIGVGVTFVASPVAGAAAEGVVNTVSSVIMEEIVKANEPKNAENAARPAGAKWEQSLESNIYLSQHSAQLAAQAHGHPYANQVADWAASGVRSGFTQAGVNVNQMGMDLETEV